MGVAIHQIGGYTIKNYLLETPVGVIAIDTGYPGDFARFKQRFEKRWPLSALKYIFITHHHDDHVGFLNELAAATKAAVILHQSALAYIALGKSHVPEGGGYSSFPASLFSTFKKDFSFPPIILPESKTVPISSDDNRFFEKLGLPVKIVCLPGHTGDSIGLFLYDAGIMFCGDAAMNAIISVARHTIWIDNAVEFGRSWDKMLSFNPAMVYPSHGTPFRATDLVKYRHYLDGKKLLPPR